MVGESFFDVVVVGLVWSKVGMVGSDKERT